ncbi:MAG: hypothetical protein Q9170_001874 [Blastenia crenularia]
MRIDEQLDVFVALRAPSSSDEWKKHLPSLQINLEVQVFGTNARQSDGQDGEDHATQVQARDIIWSGTVDTSHEPKAIEEGNVNALIWVRKCFLNRPRVRMQHPKIFFKATGILKHPPTASEDTADAFLPSGVPPSINVLEPLSKVPGLSGTRPQLTAHRLDKININSTQEPKERVIRSAPQKPFPAIPAISARVRYSKAGAYTARPSIVASLDIETAPFQNDEVELTSVNMELSDGCAEDLCKGHAINLPMTCQPRDNIVFLFRLTPNDTQSHDSKPASNSRSLDISVDARVLTSKTCNPTIQMRWKTVVDFSTALNPKYGVPAPAMQRSKKPNSLSVSDGNNRTASQDEANPSDSTEEDPPANRRGSSHASFGVTVTLTAPKDVHVGQPFTWDVFLVNHSSKARKLALLVIPKRGVGEAGTHMPKASASSNAAGQGGKTDLAAAIMDENRLHALQQSLANENVDLVCLSTETRLGTLNPGFCHNTELKFLPLAKGILHIEAVRVVDIVENKSIDIRDLPEIVAEERVGEE